MAKRVICECPGCGVETIVLKAALLADPLLECPSCGATMAADVPGVPPPAAPTPEREPPPQTIRSPREAAKANQQSEPRSPPEEERPRPPKSIAKSIAKTVPMLVTPATPPARDSRAPASAGVSPAVVVVVAAACAIGGWVAHGATRSANPDDFTNVEAECAGDTKGKSAEELCRVLLDRRP